MGYIDGAYRLERGDVWRHAGPAGWLKLRFITMPGYPDEQGLPGYSCVTTTETGHWQRSGRFYACNTAAQFLRQMHESYRFFVGKWRGDATASYARNPEARKIVLATLAPEFADAEAKGLWVQAHWSEAGRELMPIPEMRALQAKGECIFGPRSFDFQHPDTVIKGLEEDVAEAQARVDAFRARVAAAS